VEKVWGIGPQTSAYLNKFGIITTYDFTVREEVWVERNLAKPYVEIWKELRGVSVMPLILESKRTYASIQKTRTFTPPSTDARFLLSQLSKNVENACIKLRRHDLAARKMFFFFKTQEFRYHGLELKLANAVAIPSEMIRVINQYASRVIRPNVRYRASGVVLSDLVDGSALQHDLFGDSLRVESVTKIYEAIDELALRYGKYTVYLGSSARAIHEPRFAGDRNARPARHEHLLPFETARKRLAIPVLGEVR